MCLAELNVFRNILVPIDGSKYSKFAEQTAVEIAEKFEGKITLLHVGSLKASLPLDMYEGTKLITPE